MTVLVRASAAARRNLISLELLVRYCGEYGRAGVHLGWRWGVPRVQGVLGRSDRSRSRILGATNPPAGFGGDGPGDRKSSADARGWPRWGRYSPGRSGGAAPRPRACGPGAWWRAVPPTGKQAGYRVRRGAPCRRRQVGVPQRCRRPRLTTAPRSGDCAPGRARVSRCRLLSTVPWSFFRLPRQVVRRCTRPPVRPLRLDRRGHNARSSRSASSGGPSIPRRVLGGTIPGCGVANITRRVRRFSWRAGAAGAAGEHGDHRGHVAFRGAVRLAVAGTRACGPATGDANQGEHDDALRHRRWRCCLALTGRKPSAVPPQLTAGGTPSPPGVGRPQAGERGHRGNSIQGGGLAARAGRLRVGERMAERVPGDPRAGSGTP